MVNNNILIPEYWDAKKVKEAFKTKSTLELYEFFGCKNAMAFSRKMKSVFPNKPDKVPYGEYARSILIEQKETLSFAERQKRLSQQEEYA